MTPAKCLRLLTWCRRRHLGLTQAEVAAEAGVAVKTLARAERGHTLARGSFEKIARWNGLEIQDLCVTPGRYVLARGRAAA